MTKVNNLSLKVQKASRERFGDALYAQRFKVAKGSMDRVLNLSQLHLDAIYKQNDWIAGIQIQAKKLQEHLRITRTACMATDDLLNGKVDSFEKAIKRADQLEISKNLYMQKIDYYNYKLNLKFYGGN